MLLLLLVVFPNGAWPYEAHTDASTVAIGAVLLLLQNDPEQASKQERQTAYYRVLQQGFGKGTT